MKKRKNGATGWMVGLIIGMVVVMLSVAVFSFTSKSTVKTFSDANKKAGEKAQELFN